MLAQVHSFVCLLIQIVDGELETETQLDYISRQLEQLRIVERLPQSDVSAQALINSAMDVQSAVMNYIAVQIRHQSTAFGIVGISKNVTGLTDFQRKGCQYLREG